MRYVSITPEEKRLMLQVTGVDRVEDLFGTIPENLRLRETLDIPEAASETDILKYFRALGQKNASAENFEYFLGAGAYHHFIPTLIDSVISRAEFYTCYTPYQPEVSQGTLQATFEFQTLICQLTGMEVANASLYDGSSALAEGVLMAVRTTKRQKILLAQSVHPEYRRVLETYAANLNIQIQDLPFTESGCLDVEGLEQLLSKDHAAVVIQSPNFFGVLDEVEAISRLCERAGALSIVVVTEALSHDAGGVHFIQKHLRPLRVFRKNRVGMTGTVQIDKLYRLTNIRNHFDGQFQIVVFGVPLAFVGSANLWRKLTNFFATHEFHLLLFKFFYQQGHHFSRDILMNQQVFHGVAGGWVLKFRIENHADRHFDIRALIYVTMTNTFGMTQHGNFGVFLNIADKRVATARDDQIDVPVLIEHFRNLRPGFDHLNGRFRNSIDLPDCLCQK